MLRAASATQAVQGIPFDSNAIYHTGSMHGLHAIQDASEQLQPCHHDFGLDRWDAIGLVDCRDAEVVAGSAEKTFARAGLGEPCAARRRAHGRAALPASP